MSSYEYHGCVTGFSESDQVTVWQPTESPYPVQHDDNDYANRLVDVGLLAKSDCQPTILSFIPTVVMPDDKNRIILRAALKVNNALQAGQIGNIDLIDISLYRTESSFINTPQDIVNYLFLVSGGDLMRQFGAGIHFDYSPIDNLLPLQPLTIQGREKLYAEITTADDWRYVPQSINLTLKVIDDLPADAVDFVKEQWGHDVTVHSCMSIYNMGQ